MSGKKQEVYDRICIALNSKVPIVVKPKPVRTYTLPPINDILLIELRSIAKDMQLKVSGLKQDVYDRIKTSYDEINNI